MPHGNQFRHQNYPTRPVVTPVFQKLTVEDAQEANFSRLHTEFQVREVLLVHGTFMGNDPLAIAEILRAMAGSVTALQQPLSNLAERLSEHTKPFVNSVARDIGNYTPAYRDSFQQLVGDDPQVRLLSPTWSSQNHHLARADLAVRLLCHLDDLQLMPDERILLWGHSHAGNGFAILSNLLANNRSAVNAFFEAAGAQQGEYWQRARDILHNGPAPHPLAQSVLIAAFGTPVRYGWDSSGYRSLIHVLHHRNYSETEPTRAQPMFPAHSLADTISAKYGDWVQAFAIAGTDVVPPTSSEVNKRLESLLTAGLEPPVHELDTRFLVPERLRNTCARWKTGTRCHADGLNLLVEYAPCGRKTPLAFPIEEAICGHGVATTVDWLPTHLSLVMNALQ